MPRGYYKRLKPEQRFYNKFIKLDNGCWQWTGSLDREGYAVFWLGKNNVRAYRYSYELTKGKIPNGLQIDHLCRNHSCVNPDHLEPVTGKENTNRGILSQVTKDRFKNLTHCNRGHSLKGNNIIYLPKQRLCRKCNQKRQSEYYQRKKEKLNGLLP